MPINHAYTSPVADGTNANMVKPSNWNSIHAYTLQDAVSLSGNNTAGVMANINSGTLYLAGGNNITLSQSINSVSISARGMGTISNWPDVLPASAAGSTYYSGITAQGAGGNSTQTSYTFSLYVVPLPLQCPVAFSLVQIPIALGAGNVAGTGSATHVYSVGFYTNNASTLSKVCDYYAGIFHTQNSASAWTFSVFTVTTGGNTVGGPGGFAGLQAGSIQSNAGNIRNSNYINGGAYKNLWFYSNAVFTTLTEGNYWFAFANCTVSSGSNIYSISGIMQSNAISSICLLDMGINTSATANSLPGWGAISTTFTSASNAATWFPLPSAIAFSNMSSNSTSVQRYHFPILAGIT